LERSGTINKKELKEILRRLDIQISDEELDDTLKSADTNDDGVIDWQVCLCLSASHTPVCV